jgi:ribosome-binding ATPase YchF (GTP1/OBG family)
LLNHLSGLEGFVHVVRAFESASVPHPDGRVDPARDLAALDTEFLLNDLAYVERRIEKIQEGLKKGRPRTRPRPQAEAGPVRADERDAVGRAAVARPRPDEEQLKGLRGYGLLTLKPKVVLINIGDDQAEPALTYDHRRHGHGHHPRRLEMELAQLSAAGDEDSLAMFMEEYGVTELSLDRVIHLSYDLMGLQSFFTVGEDEVRAWEVKRGANGRRPPPAHPHRPGQGLHPRRGRPLRRPDRPRRHGPGPHRRQTAPRRQDIYRKP